MLEWLDPVALDVSPNLTWFKRRMRGMHLRDKKPTTCVKDLHSLAMQDANTRRQFPQHDASKLFSESFVVLPFSQYCCEEVFGNRIEADQPLVCRKAYLCRVTPFLVLHPLHRNTDGIVTLATTSFYMSFVIPILICCLYSLPKRNDHVWSLCRYTRSYNS